MILKITQMMELGGEDDEDEEEEAMKEGIDTVEQ